MKDATAIAGRRLLPERADEHHSLKSGSRSTLPTADVAPIDAEALFRLVGEGGREAPIPSLIDVPLDNAVWRRRP